ncbi:MAG: hypothetical protein A2W90_08665 [Bacteroidetes bacterium GWF2_42_66]|nr:MAG: hypothetical protein A2W92_14765 [Bacteroidetes bacterium GWA2_42_15]OFX96538.1 MAG: hypothetical protein A2W89_06325 [Bacteroidetes bacterium GWE2_42_39]OFY40958.1 MAG: hypothetical protein A2W90_08665 [Bacteroidetes bacterium GWF2_42_66]HAZ03249.1 hypothetical protein [Marinilabiliales bacterium]HBL76398.1 hypothetical protein [Prolixibacteraceae bacterium]
MRNIKNAIQLTLCQQLGIIILRIIIGWHFLYEGVTKLMNPEWSAESYMLNSRSFLSAIFREMVSSPILLNAVNFLNEWGLVMIGIGLFFGFFARVAVYGGVLLLSLYYFAYPPFGGYNFGVPQEGSYLLVDKTFIELVALIVLALFPGTLNKGLWSLMEKWKLRIHLPNLVKKRNLQFSSVEPQSSKSRRDILKDLIFLPFFGGFAWAFMNSEKETGADAITGSTIILKQKSLREIKGEMPMGILAKGKAPVSRLIMGTNHLSGTAHARDLIYASSLFKAYNTEKKIIETYMLAEKAGINLFFATPLLARYKKTFGGNFQTWINVAPTKKDIYTQVDKAIDKGVDYIFIQGATCDRRVYDGEIDVVSKCLDYIKQQGYPAGLGAHTIQALLACEEAGIEPDFYYKTMHHDKYWSAHPKENRKPFLWSSNISEDHNKFHDNMWCLFPEETIEFVQKVKKPVVGFKVLAGGAIHPKDGFQWAFDNGADFIEVGMFDFQIIENVNQAIASVVKAKNRNRPWFG